MHKFKINKIPKNIKIIIVIFIILLVLPLAISLGRYIYNKVLDLYFLTQNFYFESDKLKLGGTNYSLDYWNGVDPYEIVINLNSYKNNSLKSDTDVDYKTSFECSEGVICNVSKTTGTIYSSSNNDNFIVTVTPNKTFKDGESASIKVNASSTSPYKKDLSATFELTVHKYGLSHEISDKSGNVYLEVKVTNTLESYTVKEAFDKYEKGDQINIDTYSELSDENKKKCYSAIITMSFDPDVVYINNNSTTFLNAYNIKTKVINNYEYVNEFTFNMEANTSSTVKIYKKDTDEDYSSSGDDIVKVSYDY